MRALEPGGIPVPSGVRLVASDLDGTLLLADGSVGPRTRAALDALRDAGIGIVLVTGRPPRWLKPVAEATGHTGTAIAANGAAVVDLTTERVTRVRAIEGRTAAEVVERLRRIDDGITFAVERASLGGEIGEPAFAIDDDYQPAWPIDAGTERGPIEHLIATEGLVKLLARPPGHLSLSPDDFLAAADAALGGLVEVTHSGATGTLLEMSPAGVDKGTALAALAAERGLAAGQVVAIGDMPNDLPMLEWAGTGYAVGNAHHAVLGMAAGVLGHHDDEGIAPLLAAIAAQGSR